MMIDIKDLYQAFDIPVVIMAPGITIWDEYKKLQGIQPHIRVGCNHHMKLAEVELDYMCYLDSHKSIKTQREEFLKYYQENDPPRVTTKPNPGEFFIPNDVKRVVALTGEVALWFANYITTDKIYMAGYTLYQGDMTYFHGEYTRPMNKPLPKRLERWEKLANDWDIPKEKIIALGGPLEQVFTKFKD